MNLKHRALCLALVLSPLLMGGACTGADKFRSSRNLLGVVELGPFPKQGPGVGGYNLYLSEKKDGPFEKINSEPVLGFSRLMVPYLNTGQTYFFRMTSVASKDVNKESAPGQVFSRKAQPKAN